MDDYNYILLSDTRFITYATRELRDMLKIEGRIRTHLLDRSIYLSQINMPADQLLELLKRLRPVFTYGIVPIVERLDSFGGKGEELIPILEKHVDKKESFRIEVVSLGGKREESAKDTEVAIGKALEKEGFTISLKSPQRMLYVILDGTSVIVGSAMREMMEEPIIDHFRLENQNHDIVNRAELKMKEAFIAFGLENETFKRSLDIGASPGGWSSFLLKRGSSVVAIDKGILAYDKMPTKDIKVVDSISEYDESVALLHIKSNVSEKDKLPFKKGEFDLLTIDMNSEPSESAAVAVSLSDFVKKEGVLIMTIKIPRITEAGKLNKIKQSLESKYRVERIKKLHHNRIELTLFARKIEG